MAKTTSPPSAVAFLWIELADDLFVGSVIVLGIIGYQDTLSLANTIFSY